jgi:putative tryptophan/tyrosine transport system substrate-binding protein
MRRRDFITLLGGVAALNARPFVARAQQAGKTATIALLEAGTRSSHGSWYAALVNRLKELGWAEGHNLTIEYRWTEGINERTPDIAAELVHRKVDVIVTNGNAAVLAAKQATTTIPIVFPVAGDPVGTRLVESLARPGGNATGLSIQTPDLAGKRVELLREIAVGLRRIGILAEADNAPSLLELSAARAVTEQVGLEPVSLDVHNAEDIASAIERLKDRDTALYIVGDPLVSANEIRINTLALAARLPTMHGTREFVDHGGLMSYGPNYPDLYRRAAEYVDKILRGTNPADIPVEQPTKFDLVINRTTAKALGLSVPPTLLALADEVIE